jgi:RND family efflux transporter MFP subunit
VKRLACIFVVLLLLIGCGGQDQGMDSDVSVPVSVLEVKKGPIEEFITATGTVMAAQQAVLNAEMAGYYDLLENPKTGNPFVLGDLVQEGQSFIHLHDREYENTIALDAKKMNLEISQREFEKQKALYEKGGVTLRELNTAELDYINARYSHDNAVIQMAKMKITAPFTGVLIDLPYYTEGTRVATGSEMAELMNYSTLYLEVNLPGKEMARVTPGQSIRVMNYTLSEDTLRGEVTQVSPALDPNTRTFKATLTVDNPGWTLRPGMFVKGEMVVAENDTALVIPKEIILSKQRGKTIFIVERGTAQERVITTGLENPDFVEVVRGLRENDRVIVKGYETLQNRSRVKVVR